MKNFSPEDLPRIIEITREDRNPVEAMEHQFGLKENDVKEIMRSELKSSSFKMWRKRVSGRKTKHFSLRSVEVKRFKRKS